MAQGSRYVSDVLRIMRQALQRRNANDPDATDAVFLRYINDFVSLTMSNDMRIAEQFGTLSFTVDENSLDGVYTFNDVAASSDFVDISSEAFISLYDPVDNSISWNELLIYYDPQQFFEMWGINNNETLIRGNPTEMLFYGNEMTFRTLPDTSYLVKIYGYKKCNDYSLEGDPELQFDYWLRYVAYGACVNYANDYGFDQEALDRLYKTFNRERCLMLNHTHNRIKKSRCFPQF